MRPSTAIILSFAVALCCGCATTARHTAENRSTAIPAATTNPAAEHSIALLSLDEIEPRPTLATTGPATEPASPPPLDALALYARARESLLQNQRFTGVTLLEKAVALDPQSFELNYELGRAYALVGLSDKSLAAFERAARINADDLDAQAELGRAYYNRGDVPRAIEHLRLARQTREYADNDPSAAIVDYRLASALQQKGYDRAALEVYDDLLKRLQRPTPQMRSNAEVAYLLARPESLLQDLARLYERRGLNDEALKALEFVAQRNPDDLANQSRVINLLIAMNRGDEAIARAAEIVRRTRASAESLSLLRDAYHKLDRDADMSIELRRLYAERPGDHAILFALAESLESTGNGTAAESLLVTASEQRPGDMEILGRLVQLYSDRAQVDRAARLLVEAAAKNPDATAELSVQWSRLLRPSRRDALRLTQMRELDVSSEAQAAKWYYVARVARAWNRQLPALRAIETAARTAPPFAPAYRALVTQIWADAATPEAVKIELTRLLTDAARAAGRPRLADEIEGMMLLGRKQPDDAVKLLSRATADAHPASPEAELALASAYRSAGNAGRFEQLTWRLISDHPRFADPYATLFRFYLDQGQLNGARRVLSVWLANLPNDVDARLLEATLQLRVANQREQAERSLLALFAENADDAQVLANVRAFYAELNRLPKFIELLESELARNPQNYVAVANLVDVYATQDRTADAARVLDATRDVLADDPDRLYFIAHLYQRLGQEQMTEQVLQNVLKIDPTYAPAGNDLGYTWADAGTNLERAEMLIRRAIEQEPDNPMFLDSLGWVMYKRGRFDEARRNLEVAVAAQNATDPVVLDHLGDVLYRMNQTPEAIKQWQQSLARLGDTNADERDELKNLRLQLNQKLKQANAGEVVSAAPVVETPASPPKQAKN